MNDNTSLEHIILSLLPADGSTMGNKAVQEAIAEAGLNATEADYQTAREALLAAGLIVKGRGRGGSIAKTLTESDALVLEMQSQPAGAPVKAKSTPNKSGGGKQKHEATQVLSYC